MLVSVLIQSRDMLNVVLVQGHVKCWFNFGSESCDMLNVGFGFVSGACDMLNVGFVSVQGQVMC